MTYSEIKVFVDCGCVVRSTECLYIKPTEDSPTFWKFIGETGWTEGFREFNKCVNESEIERDWSVIFDSDNIV